MSKTSCALWSVILFLSVQLHGTAVSAQGGPSGRLVWLGVGCPAYGVSADGSVVVGGGQAFRWTPAGGVEVLGTFGGWSSEAWDVSSDGSVIVGWAHRSATWLRAFRWTALYGMQDIGTLGGGEAVAFGVSAVGSVVVGKAQTSYWPHPFHAFRWFAGVMQDLGTLGGGESEARAVSADGSVVVGWSHDAQGRQRAFRWTAVGGMQDLGTLGGANSMALDVSADGSVVVGWAEDAQGYRRAFRWTAAGGMQDLGDLGGYGHEAWAVSADGSVVVGTSRGRAFRWTVTGGMEDLNWSYIHLLPSGAELTHAFDISPNGRYIVGASNRGAYLLDTGVSAGRVAGAILQANPSTVPADNRSTSTITLTYRFSDGTPLVGRVIRFRSLRGAADTFSAETAVTDEQGKASVTVRSGVAGVSTIVCRDETGGVDLPSSTQVAFTQVEGQRRPVIESVRTSLGVPGPFVEGVPLQNTITARVAEWGASGPGRVEFRLPDGEVRSVTPSGNEASITLDMGRDLCYFAFVETNELEVTAYDAEGHASETHTVYLLSTALPPSLSTPFWEDFPEVSISPDGLSITYTFELDWPSDEADAVSQVPAPAPFMGNTVWGHEGHKFTAEVEITFFLDSRGRLQRTEATITAGAEVEKKYNRIGRRPKRTISLASLSWDVDGGIVGRFQVAPSLRLEELYLYMNGTLNVETPNLLPLLATSIPALAPAVPYAELLLRIGLSAQGQIGFYDDETGRFTFKDSTLLASLPAALILTTPRKAEDVFQVAAEGGLTFFIDTEFPGNERNASYFFGTRFLRQVGLTGYLEFILKAWFLESRVRVLEGRIAYPAEVGGLAMPLWMQSDAVSWQLPERRYVYQQPYHKLVSHRGLVPQDDWDVLEVPLVTNIMPDANPALVWKDGRAVIAYVYDDPNLPAHQSTEIRALMQQPDGSWQDVAITQDTALDSNPALAADRYGNLVAVWTRMEDVSPEPDPTLRLPKAEIAYSVYNASTGQWSAPVKYTNDTAADISPALVKGADGELYLVWLKSPDNQLPYDALNPSLPHTDIHIAYWDGSQFAWDNVAVAGANTTEAALAVNSAGAPMVVFSQDADGNPETNDTRLMYTFWDGDAWRTPVPVRGDTQPQSSPTLAIANGDLPVLFFVRSGLPHPQHEGYTQEQLVVSAFTGAGWNQPMAVTQANTLNDLQITTTPDGKVAAMWVTSSEGVADIWTTVYDGVTNTYSLPVRLTQDDMTHEQQLSAGWDPEGNPSAVYIKRQLTTEERQVQGEDGNWYPVQVTVPARADLYLLAHRPKPDLTISQLWFDPSNAGGGSRVTMTATVRNLRALGASNVKVRFYDGDPNAGGVAIGTATVSPDPLPGGAEGTASLEWTIPDDGKARTVYAVVDPDDAIAERDETNNVATWVVAQLDLQAVAPTVAEYLPDGRVKIRFGVHNPSPVRASGNVAYRLRLGDAQGEVLLQGILTVPTARESTLTEWVWDPSTLAAGRYSLYLEIDPDNEIEEEEEGNNSASTEIALLSDLLVNPALTYLDPGDNGRVRVHTTVQNNGWATAENVVVQVRTALEGGQVLASDTVARLERYGVASLTLEIDPSRADSTVWVVVNPEGSIDEVRRDNNSVGLRVAQRTYSISGQVTLEDFSGDVTRVPVEVELRRDGNVVRREVLSLDATGGYRLRDVAPGTYDLAFKASHWLRRVRTVEVASSDVLGIGVSLVNGDIDGDNEVTLVDFGVLVAAFGSVPGDSNWNPNADLDGDEEVTLVDFGILVRNFGQIGDE